MPACTVRRTHSYGRQLQDRDWKPVPGPISMCSIYWDNMRRYVQCFRVMQMNGGASLPSPIPDLMDVELLTFSTDWAMMVRGFEEIEGARYYQGWYITWD